MQCLDRYLPRPHYIQKTLYYLFKMTNYDFNYEPKIEMSLPRIDIIYVSWEKYLTANGNIELT